METSMDVDSNTSAERKAWWSAQRRRYNMGLIVAAPISAALVVTVWAVFEERLPCLEVTGFSLVVGLTLFASAWVQQTSSTFLDL